MFKSILPSRRVPSGDFTIITNLVDASAKENQPTLPGNTQMPATKGKTATKGFMQMNDKKKKADAKKVKDTPVAEVPMSAQEFDKLLDDLQIPASLRPKLYGMDASVKAAMLKSSQTMAISPLPEPEIPTTPRANRSLRRAHSIESISPRQPTLASLAAQYSELSNSPGSSAAHVSAHHSPYLAAQRKASGHARGMSMSFEAPRLFSKSQVNLASSSSLDLIAGGKGIKEKGALLTKNLSPTKFCSILTGTSSTQLDVEDLKKLRLLLRNEAASWSQEFLKLGGYSALLTRLNEILEVEWREEQHDDQVLHQLLLCFKALSTSSIGCFALRSSCPTPFVQLVALLYSDKKPGEVATRQLIVELLLLLFDLYPPSSLPSASIRSGAGGSSLLAGNSRPREAWESQTSLVTSNLVTLPAPHKNLFSLVRALLLTPAPPASESPAAPISPHAFIESLHTPRIYKTYLKELSEVCRDYFWVFCHPHNTIWVLSETNESSVEKPRAPGGMTGGVEFEAMAYFTTQLKLVNAIAKCVEGMNMPREHELSAHRFHTDLFLSGLERVVLISRKASTTYYPNLHLELARYIAYAMRSGYELPYTVDRLVGMPPDVHAKNPKPAAGSGRSTPREVRTPTKRSPALPSPMKVEPMKFDL
ncbi:armadillo-type protein [Crassisporium funariophilum]|nr:armadillo-type protein [Crassisporium funariophilum]